MKSIGIIAIAAIVLFLFPCVSTADNWKNESGKNPKVKPGFRQDDRHHEKGTDDRRPDRFKERRDDRDYSRGPDDRRPDRFKERRDYHQYRGYRERPYDRNRHYDRHTHRDKRYDYNGHWRSWDEWNRYAKRHPDVYKHGHYYREDAHLMFRFCDPGSSACFFFSIGK